MKSDKANIEDETEKNRNDLPFFAAASLTALIISMASTDKVVAAGTVEKSIRKKSESIGRRIS